MTVNITKLPDSQVEILIEESAEKVAKSRKSVLEDAAKHVKVNGFRQGAKIPEEMVIRQLGEETILQMTVEKAIDESYRKALKDNNLMPVSQAEIVEIESQSPLKVKIRVEVFPEVKVKDSYKKVKLEKKAIEVSDDEVTAALADIQTRFTHFHDVAPEHAAHMGDRVTMDTDGYDMNGKLLESTSMREYPLVLGSNLLVAGFEEQIVGMKTGETKEIEVTFPKEYHNADFAGKKTKFSVSVKKIEHAHKPEFTEEFIEQLRGKKLDLEGFKALVKEEIKETKQANDAMEREMKLIDELVSHVELELGPKILAEQTNIVFNEIKENIARDGVKVVDYLASLGLSEDEYKEKHVSDAAKKRLQGELIFSEIMKLEKVEVSDEEINMEIEKIISRYGSDDVIARLKELYVPGNRYYEELKRRMGMRKLIDSFFETK